MKRYILKNRDTRAVFRTVYASPRETLYDALERNGVPIRTACRGSTICGQCWVFVEAGHDAAPPPASDELALVARFAPAGAPVRLACRLRLSEEQSALEVSTTYWGDAAD